MPGSNRRYCGGINGSAGTLSTAQFDLTPQNSIPVYLYELGISTSANSSRTCTLGLAVLTANIGTGSAGVAPSPYDLQDPTASMRHHVTWTVQPTAPANWMRRIALPATAGRGIILRWPEHAPLKIPGTGSLLIYNIALSALCDFYYEAEEKG